MNLAIVLVSRTALPRDVETILRSDLNYGVRLCFSPSPTYNVRLGLLKNIVTSARSSLAACYCTVLQSAAESEPSETRPRVYKLTLSLIRSGEVKVLIGHPTD